MNIIAFSNSNSVTNLLAIPMANKQLLIVGLATFLLSCDADLCERDDSCPVDVAPGQEGVALGDNYLDCSNLDPDKVYLHGTLGEGASYLDALTDPANPTLFCVGFETTRAGTITEQGKYVYGTTHTDPNNITREIGPIKLLLKLVFRIYFYKRHFCTP